MSTVQARSHRGERDKPVSYCNISMCQIFPSVPVLETSTHSLHIAQYSEFPPTVIVILYNEMYVVAEYIPNTGCYFLSLSLYM